MNEAFRTYCLEARIHLLFAHTKSRGSMFPSDAEIMQFFAQYAHSPAISYSLFMLIMFLSSFGLPIPEEVAILALGLIVYMGHHPDLFPPAAGVALQPLNLYTAMAFSMFAVMFSDSTVYFLGKKFGDSPILHKLFRKFLGEKSLEKCRNMVHKYRYFVPAVFRFTPGLRFPGHLTCGMMGIKPITFLLSDGIVALLSVPTQVYLFATYGEEILAVIKKIKSYALIIIVILVAIWILYKLKQKFFGKKEAIS